MIKKNNNKKVLKTQVAPISSHGITPGYFYFGSEQTAFGLRWSASDWCYVSFFGLNEGPTLQWHTFKCLDSSVPNPTPQVTS